MFKAQTKIIAHRGFSSIAPENTISAFQKAIDIKADYIELDVHKTKDGSIVVIHDATVDRTSSNEMTGEVLEMTYAELEGVKVGNSVKFGDQYSEEKIPTLGDVLELAKGKIKVCIEIKVLSIEKDVLKIINDSGMWNEIIIFSFHYPVLAKIRQLDEDISILYLVDKADKISVDYAKIINCNYIGAGNETLISKEFIDFSHAQNIKIFKWTVDEEQEMKELIEMGIDGIITNRPDAALKFLQGH